MMEERREERKVMEKGRIIRKGGGEEKNKR